MKTDTENIREAEKKIDRTLRGAGYVLVVAAILGAILIASTAHGEKPSEIGKKAAAGATKGAAVHVLKGRDAEDRMKAHGLKGCISVKTEWTCEVGR